MIAYLSGNIIKKVPNGVILNTGNIGYLIQLPTPLLEKAAEKSDAAYFIFTKVREDDISLYGFATTDELNFFKLLLNVNGIGPKLGLEIISQDQTKVKSALINGDLNFLTKIPGIGKKMAERMIVELKGKIVLAKADYARTHNPLDTPQGNEAISALITLGYQKAEIRRTLKDMPENINKTEDIITYFLKNV
jgi:Holliday junction DNA helicase RuvA